jgi:hypothetical protein
MKQTSGVVILVLLVLCSVGSCDRGCAHFTGKSSTHGPAHPPRQEARR